MPHVDLPRALEEYFAFAETEKRRETRHFTITLPYLADQQLGRLQWWWRVRDAQETVIGDAGLAQLKAREVEKFKRHIERWLANTGQRLHGDEPIPRIAPLPQPQVSEPVSEPASQKSPGEELRYA